MLAHLRVNTVVFFEFERTEESVWITKAANRALTTGVVWNMLPGWPQTVSGCRCLFWKINKGLFLFWLMSLLQGQLDYASVNCIHTHRRKGKCVCVCVCVCACARACVSVSVWEKARERERERDDNQSKGYFLDGQCQYHPNDSLMQLL